MLFPPLKELSERSFQPTLAKMDPGELEPCQYRKFWCNTFISSARLCALPQRTQCHITFRSLLLGSTQKNVKEKKSRRGIYLHLGLTERYKILKSMNAFPVTHQTLHLLLCTCASIKNIYTGKVKKEFLNKQLLNAGTEQRPRHQKGSPPQPTVARGQVCICYNASWCEGVQLGSPTLDNGLFGTWETLPCHELEEDWD